VIQVRQRGDDVTRLRAELRRVQVGQGSWAEDLGDGQSAGEHFGVGERGGRQATEGLLKKAGGPGIRHGGEDRVAQNHDSGPARRAETRPRRHGSTHRGSELAAAPARHSHSSLALAVSAVTGVRSILMNNDRTGAENGPDSVRQGRFTATGQFRPHPIGGAAVSVREK
jgi:hypothetical protein